MRRLLVLIACACSESGSESPGSTPPPDAALQDASALCVAVCEVVPRRCRLVTWEGCPAACEREFRPLVGDERLACLAAARSCAEVEACSYDASTARAAGFDASLDGTSLDGPVSTDPSAP